MEPCPASAASAAAAAGSDGSGRVDVRLAVISGASGSGKTTLCGSLASTTWVRASQDDSGGDRRRVESRVDTVLRNGGRVLVDRCNHTPAQRAHWVKIASRHGATAVAVCLEGVSPEECLDRIRARQGHPSLTGDTPGLGAIVRAQHRDYTRAHLREGFARVLACPSQTARDQAVEFLGGGECNVSEAEAEAAAEAARGAGSKGQGNSRAGRGRGRGRGRGTWRGSGGSAETPIMIE